MLRKTYSSDCYMKRNSTSQTMCVAGVGGNALAPTIGPLSTNICHKIQKFYSNISWKWNFVLTWYLLTFHNVYKNYGNMFKTTICIYRRLKNSHTDDLILWDFSCDCSKMLYFMAKICTRGSNHREMGNAPTKTCLRPERLFWKFPAITRINLLNFRRFMPHESWNSDNKR